MPGDVYLNEEGQRALVSILGILVPQDTGGAQWKIRSPRKLGEQHKQPIQVTVVKQALLKKVPEEPTKYLHTIRFEVSQELLTNLIGKTIRFKAIKQPNYEGRNVGETSGTVEIVYELEER